MPSKLDHLREILLNLGNALIAYSGGVDSAFLTKVAHDSLGNRVIALTAVSPSYPSYELAAAKKFAEELGVRHLIVNTQELKNENYRANRGDRCYFCKSELYQVCWQKADELKLSHVLNGTILDDLGDVRPGLAAASERKIRSPLVEAGFTKKEVREYSRDLGLAIWEKPALACLSSRFPPGTEVTEEKLKRIDRIETELVLLGFKQFRVRFHEEIARIEVGPDEVAQCLDTELRKKISHVAHENGFRYVTLDLDGYRTGSVNPALAQIKMGESL